MLKLAPQPSIIPACDVESLEALERLVTETSATGGIGAYKVGLELGLSFGLPRVVEAIRPITSKPIIYDHQKAATDIPALGAHFATMCRRSGIDAVILFPLAGPVTEREWIKACLGEGLGVIVGGFMTHEGFAAESGGFISEAAAFSMYEIAMTEGIRDFIVPATRPDMVRRIVKLLGEQRGGCTVYAPGFIAQGGTFAVFRQAVGATPWHAIIGTALYKAPDIHRATLDLLAQLQAA